MSVQFSGQGIVALGQTNAGVLTTLMDVGNVNALKFALKTETTKIKESRSGQRGLLISIDQGKEASVDFTATDWDLSVLALALYGAKSTIASGTVTNEAFPTVAVGDIVALKKPPATSVVLTDSAGSPTTLVEGTHYSFVGPAKAGMIKILSLSSLTQPIKAAYSNGAATNINMFTTAAPERWLRFIGINTANSNKLVLVDLYRVKLLPTDGFDLISESGIASFPLKGDLYLDSTKESDTVLGQYGRILDLDVA